jgi:hypothetical protein
MGDVNNITVHHCLILVTVRDYMALPHGPASGFGSGAKSFLGAGQRVLTP